MVTGEKTNKNDIILFFTGKSLINDGQEDDVDGIKKKFFF